MFQLLNVLILSRSKSFIEKVRPILEGDYPEVAKRLIWKPSLEEAEIFSQDNPVDIAIVDSVLGEESDKAIFKSLRSGGSKTTVIRLDAEGRAQLVFIPGNEGDTLSQSIHCAMSVVNKADVERERLMISSLEQSSEGVLITDNHLAEPGPHIVYANGAMEEICGYNREELIGKNPRILQGEKTEKSFRKQLLEACLEGREFIGKTINYRKDGSEYRMRSRIRPLRDRQGNISHYISTIRDVTKEEEQGEELQRSQSFLLEIGNMALVGGWRFDKAKNELHWTDQTYLLHGLKPGTKLELSEAIGFYREEDRGKLEIAFEACLNEGIPYDLVLGFRSADGGERWCRTKGEPIFNSGEIIGAWGVFQDITDVFNLESEHDSFYDLAVELSCIFSTSGYFIEVGKRWENALGYPTEEIPGKSIFEFVHPDDQERTLAAIKELLKKKTVYGFENRCLHRDGHYIFFHWNAKLGPDGKRIFALARDITERREREISVQNALHEAKIANNAKNQFLMVMSHELRTPLNPVMACSDLLLEKEKDPENKVMLRLIKDSAKHLSSLIGDILDLSSIESGRVSLTEENFDVVEAVHSCLELMRPRAVAKGLRLELDCPNCQDKRAPVYCCGDARKFRQIVLNLLGNAIKFTHDGFIRLECHYDCPEEGSCRILIRFLDTGIGIPEKEHAAIFEPFYQVSMSKSRQYKGQGIGLALSRELARAMGGYITVQSAVGEGSVFTLELSLAASTGVQSDEPVSRDTEADAVDEKFRVLIVEDDPVNKMVLEQLLKRIGAVYTSAGNGQEAVEITAEEAFDCILMDIQMPIMDGIEATRIIRNMDNPNKHTPIIAVTAHALKSIKDACFEVGMDDFIEKPVSLNMLKNKLKINT